MASACEGNGLKAVLALFSAVLDERTSSRSVAFRRCQRLTSRHLETRRRLVPELQARLEREDCDQRPEVGRALLHSLAALRRDSTHYLNRRLVLSAGEGLNIAWDSRCRRLGTEIELIKTAIELLDDPAMDEDEDEEEDELLAEVQGILTEWDDDDDEAEMAVTASCGVRRAMVSPLPSSSPSSSSIAEDYARRETAATPARHLQQRRHSLSSPGRVTPCSEEMGLDMDSFDFEHSAHAFVDLAEEDDDPLLKLLAFFSGEDDEHEDAF